MGLQKGGYEKCTDKYLNLQFQKRALLESET